MAMTRVPMPPRPMVTIAFQVPPAVFDGLQDLARRAGHPRDLYASNLLIAAYSARRGPTGDAALDEAVARLNVKHSGQFPAKGKEGESAAITAREARIAEIKKELAEEAALRVGAIERMKSAEAECKTLETLLNDEKIANAQLFSELHALREERAAPAIECAAEPEVKPEPDHSYGLCRRAKAEAPHSDDAPLTKSFVKIVAGYRYANTSVEQIALLMDCDVAAVRRAIEASGRRA